MGGGGGGGARGRRGQVWKGRINLSLHDAISIEQYKFLPPPGKSQLYTCV